jgi:uncharacterized iron-regulated membrane protein
VSTGPEGQVPKARWRRGLFKVHQAVGLAGAALLAVSAVTGTLLVFRGALGAGPPPRAPEVARPLPLEALIERAVAAGPGDPVTDITLPLAAGEPYQLFLDDDDETVVYLAGDGAVLGTRATAHGLTRALFRLHTGEVIGTPGEALVVVGGASITALLVTGLAMWAARRRPRRPAAK